MALLPVDGKTRRASTQLYGAGAVLRFSGCVACDKRLTQLDAKILSLITSFADFGTAESYPSVATLAALVGSPRTSIQRALNRLKGLGYLFVERRYDANGACLSNLYVPNLGLANIDGRIYLPISNMGWSVEDNPAPMPQLAEAPPASPKRGDSSLPQEEAQREQLSNNYKKARHTDREFMPVDAERTAHMSNQVQASEMWLSKQDKLRIAVDVTTYRTWFDSHIEAINVKSGRLFLKAPSIFWARKLEDEYLAVVEDVVGMPITIIC